MKKSLLSIAILAATMSGFAMAGNAGPMLNDSGVYLEGAIGPSYLQDEDIYDTTAQYGANSDYKLGWTGGLGLGYRFNQNWRLGFNVNYNRNSLKKIIGGDETNASRGYARAITYMLNGYYDINLHSVWTPFFGLGLGAATMTHDFKQGGNYKYTDTAFAYQAIVGVSYAINHQLDAFADFRHLGTTQYHTQLAGYKIQSYYQNNFIDLGLRYTFR